MGSAAHNRLCLAPVAEFPLEGTRPLGFGGPRRDEPCCDKGHCPLDVALLLRHVAEESLELSASLGLVLVVDVWCLVALERELEDAIRHWGLVLRLEHKREVEVREVVPSEVLVVQLALPVESGPESLTIVAEAREA